MLRHEIDLTAQAPFIYPSIAHPSIDCRVQISIVLHANFVVNHGNYKCDSGQRAGARTHLPAGKSCQYRGRRPAGTCRSWASLATGSRSGSCDARSPPARPGTAICHVTTHASISNMYTFSLLTNTCMYLHVPTVMYLLVHADLNELFQDARRERKTNTETARTCT